MYNFFGIKIDTSSMTNEELQEARKEIRKILADVEFQLQLRKLAEHKHSS